MASADHKITVIRLPEEGRRSCVECRATTTPKWRGGPMGPRSLCNARGIRYRKKRRQELGLDHKQAHQQHAWEIKTEEKERTEAKESSNNSCSSSSNNLEVVQKRRILMGVEEAAFLLMTLSSSPTSSILHG